jgi:hypothetical protein
LKIGFTVEAPFPAIKGRGTSIKD